MTYHTKIEKRIETVVIKKLKMFNCKRTTDDDRRNENTVKQGDKGHEP
jgi:hypothetical protein